MILANFNFTNFARNFISWFLGVLITYMFIQFTVKYVLGIKSSKHDESVEKTQEKSEEKSN